MGCLRFLLALAVVIFHAEKHLMTGGGPSVQGFYIVSGFFMTFILNEKYNTPDKNTLFITNRLLRIWSIYWVILLLSGAYSIYSGTGPIALLGTEYSNLSFPSLLYIIFSNIFLLGLDFGLFMGLSNGHLIFQDFTASLPPRLYEFTLVSQAWSLGVEMLFYMVAPFIVRRSWPIVLTIALAGLIGRMISGLDGDPWANRFFPFELSIFLLGSLSYFRFAKIKHRQLNLAEKIFGASPILLVIAYPWYGREDLFFQPGRIVLLAGIAAGLPYLFHMTRNISLDRSIGNLSYPLYLCHMLVISILSTLPGLSGPWFWIAVVAASIALAKVTEMLIEVPVERFRERRWQRYGLRPSGVKFNGSA